MTLASAAPIRVPARPKKEATTAEDAAARGPAATWVALSWAPCGFSSGCSGRSVVSGRGEVMSSGGVDDVQGDGQPSRGGGARQGCSPGYGCRRGRPAPITLGKPLNSGDAAL